MSIYIYSKPKRIHDLPSLLILHIIFKATLPNPLQEILFQYSLGLSFQNYNSVNIFDKFVGFHCDQFF
jgi:hypothetical protein